MAWQKVAGGGPLDLADLALHEDEFPEGSKGKLEVYLRWSLSGEQIQDLNNALIEHGVNLSSPVTQIPTGSATLIIEFTKGQPQLGLIVIALIAAAIIVVALVVGWALFLGVVSQFGPVGVALVAFGIVAGIVLIGKGAKHG